jgi:hypothetical protein
MAIVTEEQDRYRQQANCGKINTDGNCMHVNNITYLLTPWCRVLVENLTGLQLVNTMFSNTFSFLSSHNVSDQVSHPYKTGNIIVLYILIFKFLEGNLEDKRFCTE